MAKTKSTKRALLMSGLALFACISMLVGSTFAWFTDSVTSGKNIIAAGNLDVELYYSYDGAKWEPVKANTNVFKEGALWEPGYTEYVYLKVVNEGSLALEYNLNVNVASETGSVNVYGRDFLLSEHIKYGVVDYTNPFTGRDAAIDAVKSVAKNLENGYSHDTKALEPKGEDVYAMVVYMPTTVDNEANHAKGEVQPKIQLGINLFATQFTHEEDSFGKDYDDAARYTIAAGEEATMSDDTITAGMDNAGSVTVNGGTIDNEGAGLFNTGDAELTGVTINAGSPSDYAVIGQGSNSVTVLDGATLNSNGGGIGVADGAKMTVKGGTVHVDTTSTSGRYNIYAVGENTVVNVEGGEYSWDSSKNQKRAYIYAAAGAVVNVKGGTFGKASTRNGYTDGILTGANGTVVITGGTFGFDPTKWLAPGYQATKIGDNWIVAPGKPAYDSVDVIENLEKGEDVALMNDVAIDKTELNSNGYGATGINVKEGQTIDGQGHTLDIQGAGGTWDSGICLTKGTVKNITVTGSFRGIFIKNNVEKVYLENVITDGTVYTISCDQGGNGGLEATNCTFNGWTSFAATIGDVKFTDCKFGEGSGYAFCRPYAPTTFVGCDFEAGFTVDPRSAVVFENCTIGGVALTAENVDELVTNTANVTVK